MSEENSTATIELNEPAATEAAKIEAPTRDDLKAKGWSVKELESAEKRGMIAKKEEKKPEEKKTEEPEIAGNPGGTDSVPVKPEEKEAPKVNPFAGTQHLRDVDLTPEQEKVFFEAFPPLSNGKLHPVKALYLERKNERHARQSMAAENKELRERLRLIEAMKSQPTTQRDVEVDADGNEIDPEDKPLTLKQLREMQQKEAEEAQKKEREIQEQAHVVTEAQRSQEEYARAVLPDFDDSIKLAKEVMGNLDTLVPEKWKQGRVIDLIQKLQVAAANAHKYGLDDYNAAFIAHEIGQFHPNYGKAANGMTAETHNDGKAERPETKANGGLTPEQMKRMEANTQRRASSASIPGGGGKRTVSVDDVGLPELNRMSFEERQRFKDKHPDRYAKLLRG